MMLPPAAIGAFGRSGLQKVALPYDEVTEAPRTGYDEREPLPVSVGDVVVVRATVGQICFGAFTPFIHAKFLIESIDLVDRAFAVKMRVNPNCGFRSFEEGIPSF